MFFALIILIVNVGISWWNARVVGQVWPLRRQLEGFESLVMWSGATMSVIGFTYTYLILLSLGLVTSGKASTELVEGMFALGYVLLVPALLASGTIIWLHSVRTAIRDRSFSSMGVAGWNTFAHVSNTVNAVRFLPKEFEKVTDLIGGKKSNSVLALIVVVAALSLGFLTTSYIIRSTAVKTRYELAASTTEASR